MKTPHRLSASVASVVALLLLPGALRGLAAPSGSEIRVTVAGTPTYPVTAVFPDGGFVVAWTTGRGSSAIHARVFTASGTPASGELRLVPPQPVSQLVDGVAITTDGGFVVVWEKSRPKDPYHLSVLARKFDRQGRPLTAAFQVHDASPYSRYEAVVAGMPDGGFVVAWGSDSPPSPLISLSHTDVYARFFHGDGTAAGPALLLAGGGPAENDPLDDSGIVPAAMAAAPDGSVALVSNCFCDEPGLVLQRFTREGAAGYIDLIPPDCTSCSDTLTLFPSLAMAPDGSFVVSWQTTNGQVSTNPNVPPSVIRARRFAADGTGLGSDFQVNQQGRFTTGSSVAVLADGSFVIAWTDENGRDGNLSGVFARSYDANGATSGPDLQLDVKATGDQFLQSVVAAGNRAVAVWVSERSTRIVARLLTPH